MSELLKLDGRVAIVTGGARGLGLAIARRIAEAGASVVLADLDENATRRAAESLKCGDRAIAARLDVTDADATHALADRVAEELGRLDIWINNAGIFPPEDPATVDAAQVRRVLDVNLVGTYMGAQAAARRMKTNGVIINIASTSAFRGRTAGSYAASKWGVRGLTHGLSAELGEQGIRVVGIAPAIARTEGTELIFRTDEVWETIASAVPLGREGLADDVARLAVFLASDAASYITGFTIPVDGGALSVSTIPASATSALAAPCTTSSPAR